MRLPEVNDSSYFAECDNRKYRIILFLRVQLPEVNDSSYFEEYLSRVLCLSVCDCVCVCVCVTIAERSPILFALVIKLTKATRRRVCRGRD